KRRVVRNNLANFTDSQIAARVGESADDCVIHSVINELVRDLAEMFGRDEIMRRDGGAEKGTKVSFVLPAAASQSTSRLGGVSRGVVCAVQDHAVCCCHQRQERDDAERNPCSAGEADLSANIHERIAPSFLV